MTTEKNLIKPAIIMALIVTLAVTGWELYLRQKGVPITYDDEAELWSDKRASVYEPTDKATVFIGTSRIKYDLDIDTWKKITGKDAVQLAIEGNSPLTILEDLGNDTNFKGNLVIDATEVLFFSLNPQFNTKPQNNINYYHKETYAQKASFQLNRILESQLVFLDQKFLSLNAELGNLPIHNRPGIAGPPVFPHNFWNVGFSRQNKMSTSFLTDTAQKNEVTAVWSGLLHLIKTSPPPKENPIPIIQQKAKNAIDKIRARGGKVIFVRPPSSGPFWAGEQQLFNRRLFWDPLLAVTHTSGIFFADYPALDHFECPEWSHLKPTDAVKYTTALIKLLPQAFVK